MSSYPRISEVRFYRGAVTVELSNGVSYEADTAEQIEAIAEASMHSVEEIRDAIDNASIVMTRTLEHRTNNAYDSILLVDGGEVIGAWTVGERGDEMANFANPGDLADWEPTHPDNTSPDDYGDLVASK